MPTSTDHPPTEPGRPGDWVEVRGLRGQQPRRGEIVEVLGGAGHVRYRVRWDERHESVLFPADGVIIRPSQHRD